MWVVKLGGSLHGDALLPAWLHMLARDGAGRAVLVPGGGAFADAVRAAQARWRFDDLAAHNMALLAMVQTAYQWRAMCPALQLLADESTIPAALAAGRAVLWSPLALLAELADADTNWDVTSDSLAWQLARRLGAQELVLVKSCTIDAGAGLDTLGAAGVVDRRLATLARTAPPHVRLLPREGMAQLALWLAAGAPRAPS